MTQEKSGRFALGVDIGGTFTDLALLDRQEGRLHVGKVLTNYTDLARGVLDGVTDLVSSADVQPDQIKRLVHGTTLATNALIQRKGARTALLVTRGFRDLLEMGRESRFDIYDLELELPAPLVPRHLVYEISERLDQIGAVITPLDLREIAEVAAALERDGIEAAAVCFLHAFRNPQHERSVRHALGKALPDLAISLSSEVMPDIREYERASTTVANAYVQPAVKRYLRRLSQALEERDLGAALNIMASDGGTMSMDVAERYPVRIVESGPAGGAIASAHLGKLGAALDVIGFDMGGTTAKFCVIENAQPARSTAFEVGRAYRFAKGSGLPIKAPVVEMIEIGAGGGSIARVESLTLLKVGPDSAGSSPGPACYGLGGKLPTVTDADLVLGYLDPDGFLGGRLKLDRQCAEKAILENVANPLGLSLLRTAWGIHEIVNDNMARAAKVHCMERGKDPRRFTLIAYGGAGPVHGYRLALALGMHRIIYPARAGVMSAIGFLIAPTSFELVRSFSSPLETADTTRIRELLDEMESEGRLHVRSGGIAPDDITVTREAAVRYAGQSFDINVPVPNGSIGASEIARIGQEFLRLYRQRYHRTNPGVPLEIVSWRVLARGPNPNVDLAVTGGGSALKPKRTRQVFMPEDGRMMDCNVYARSDLRPGMRFKGPAIVEEDESTAVIGRQGVAEIDGAGNLVVTIPKQVSAAIGRQRAQTVGEPAS
jgi:N-methylhydantoinase A